MGIIIELRNPETPVEDKIKSHRHSRTKNYIMIFLVIVSMFLSTYLLIEVQTFTKMRSVQEYKTEKTDNSNYRKYSDGILKYSRDGAVYISKTGEEIWNQSYQIKTPFVHVNKNAVVIGDKGGNDLYIFDEKGLKGEVHTNHPIESAVVAANGIVSVLQKNGMSPKIICYDAAGTVLIEHSASLSGTGYPIGMAISPDGTMLQVSYLCVADGVEAVKVIYYSFSGSAKKDDHQVTEDLYKNMVIPTSFFVNESKSILVGDSGFLIYEGKEKPKLTRTVEINKEIQSVFYDEEYLGFVVKDVAEEESEVRLYNMKGDLKMSKTFVGEYGNVHISEGDVLMYDGNKCQIISKWGVKKFEGDLEKDIKEILPLTGMNMYLVISNDGMDEVRLVK